MTQSFVFGRNKTTLQKWVCMCALEVLRSFTLVKVQYINANILHYKQKSRIQNPTRAKVYLSPKAKD